MPTSAPEKTYGKKPLVFQECDGEIISAAELLKLTQGGVPLAVSSEEDGGLAFSGQAPSSMEAFALWETLREAVDGALPPDEREVAQEVCQQLTASLGLPQSGKGVSAQALEGLQGHVDSLSTTLASLPAPHSVHSLYENPLLRNTGDPVVTLIAVCLQLVQVVKEFPDVALERQKKEKPLSSLGQVQAALGEIVAFFQGHPEEDVSLQDVVSLHASEFPHLRAALEEQGGWNGHQDQVDEAWERMCHVTDAHTFNLGEAKLFDPIPYQQIPEGAIVLNGLDPAREHQRALATLTRRLRHELEGQPAEGQVSRLHASCLELLGKAYDVMRALQNVDFDTQRALRHHGAAHRREVT